MTTLLQEPIGKARAGSENQDVILVDENDCCIGFMPKQEAHENGGALHRAFSVFIFDAAGRMLLQQRAHHKYHFAGLWTNACCSHPRRGEELEQAALRRVREELGLQTPLLEIFSFIYHAHDEDSGLTEREFDHVFVGEWNGEPQSNAEEIAAWKWMDVAELQADLNQNPQCYTTWFRIALERVLAHRLDKQMLSSRAES